MPSTNAAVQATTGEVLRYAGKVAVTYYFSTSGGRTENVENVFYGAKPTPYLQSVDDPYDNLSPKHRWTFRFTTRQIRAKLKGYVNGRFLGVKVKRRGISPRVVDAIVRGRRAACRSRARRSAQSSACGTPGPSTRGCERAPQAALAPPGWRGSCTGTGCGSPHTAW